MSDSICQLLCKFRHGQYPGLVQRLKSDRLLDTANK
jgi:hypothetical protein